MKNKRSFVNRVMFLFVAVLIPGIMLAQTKTITGVVKDATGEAVIGASVTVKGTTKGTITDSNGAYKLQVPETAKAIVISYIGMKKKEVSISGPVINANLESESKELNETVIIGYGTVKKSDLTGAVSSAGSKTLTEKGVTNVVSALQGSVAGVQIQQNSSRAGAAMSIIVRGQNSVSGNTAPLYVVDGVISSSIDFLNPQDIEKIDILKDASSTAIYGSRGSNGVVIVQTKSGSTSMQAAKTVISYDGYYGVSKIARMPEFMDTQEWMKYRILNYQYSTDANNDGVLEFSKADLKNVWMGGVTTTDLGGGNIQPVYPAVGTAAPVFSGSQWLLNRYLNNETTDWTGLVSQNGIQQNHYLDISGGSKDVAYSIGAGYQNETGVFINDRYERYNLKGSILANLNDKWQAGFNITTAYSNQESGSDNAILSAFRMAPIVTAFDDGKLDRSLNHIEGNIIVVPGKTNEVTKDANNVAIFPNSIGSGGFTSSLNPLIDLANTSNNTAKINALGSAFLKFSPFKNFSVKTTISPSVISYRTGLYKSTLTEGNYDNPLTSSVEANAIANITNYTYFNYTWDNQANYKIDLGNHTIDLLALYSVYGDKSESYNTNTTGYTYDYEWYNLGGATVTANTKLGSIYSGSTMQSVAARASYSYKGKYLLTGTVRSDGSSKLAKDYQWNSFPSVSAAWRASEESFFEPVKSIVSNLKLRASLGYTGNNNIDPYTTQRVANANTYYNYGTTNAFGVAVGPLANQALTWERTRELNAGVDFGFLNNHLNFSVDVYDRLSKGLLQKRTLPLESGAGTMIDNLGSVSNKGVELSLNAALVNTKHISWSISGTFTANQNKIVNLFGNTTPGYIFVNNSSQKWMIGENINSIYGYVFDGVWTAQGVLDAIAAKDPRAVNSAGKVLVREGQAKVVDYDGNGIDANDRRIQGHADPNWTAGLTSNLTAYGFDFSFSLYTAQGMTVFSPFIEEFTNYNDRGRQKLKMDYYVPAGVTMLAPDGSFYTQTTAINNQSRPAVYTDNANNTNSGPYWHNGKETARDMPGSWVDASFLKVRNITLGYTLPKSLIAKAGIKNLRVYANVLNPFVFTDYKGFDPEWADASMGKDNGPATTTYQFGVNLKF